MTRKTLECRDLANGTPPRPHESTAAFHDFQQVYNEERPHQALGNTPPADHYSPSARSWDGVLRQPERIAWARSATPMPR